MVRIAQERVRDLFGLAEREALGGHPDLSDRYVHLARQVGARYNVRLLPEQRELYCRGCSAYWIEGRTVRTRLRSGRRVRTCLRCGRERRIQIRAPRKSPSRIADGARAETVREQETEVAILHSADESESLEEESEQE
jgi:ribonuclease P protein subunit RPR2